MMSLSSTSLCRHLVVWTGLLCIALASAEKPAPQVLAGLAYKSGGDLTPYETERCKLDLYLPAGKKDFPTLVWLHGGGLTGGSKDGKDVVAVARHFAEAGVAVANLNYRLSPKAKYPAYIEDAAAAFAWVKKHIGEHGGKTGKVFIGGHSAGGYLTLMVGLDPSYLKAQGLDTSAIAGMVPVSGQTLTHYTIREERGLPKTRLIADEAAPLYHARKDAPPMLILYADKDMAMRAEENVLLAAALREAGHKQTVNKMIKGRTHGSIGHAMANAGDEGFDQVMKFIQTTAP